MRDNASIRQCDITYSSLMRDNASIGLCAVTHSSLLRDSARITDAVSYNIQFACERQCVY